MEGELELLRHFLGWLLVNLVELRGCTIKFKDACKGFGVVSSSIPPNNHNESVLLVVPLDMAITPMRVIQDPLIGPECRAMFEEGEVDDRFLIIMFLLVERLRKGSTWKPYLDMLPRSFGNPLWFNEDELLELKGTTLYRATELQKQQLISLFENKVEGLINKVLAKDGNPGSAVRFEDFLWANSVFWARAMNIPLPHSYVFPKAMNDEADCNEKATNQATFIGSEITSDDTVWVEGIIPGIDFCNHEVKAQATWEIDRTGNIAGVPFSMYLRSAEEESFQIDQEISISYGNKGNEELLYLYGFVMDNNPDDYLMIHYPVEALKNSSFSETKLQLLEAQKAELRYLLPKGLLHNGFTATDITLIEGPPNTMASQVRNYSWSGQRKVPSYLNKLVFPEGLLTTLRTIAIQEHELQQVCSSLEQMVGNETREPTSDEVRAAIWEVCGDSGALQLLVDLLQTKLMDLEEGSGSEECDTKLLDEHPILENMYQNELKIHKCDPTLFKTMSLRRWSCIVYRRGQKQLSKLFLREAEHVLQLCLKEDK